MAYRLDKVNYVYAIVCHTTLMPVYIGLSSVPERRFKEHFSLCHNFYLFTWLRECRDKKIMPTLKILETIPVGVEPYSIENKWIRHYKNLNCELYNSVIKGYTKYGEKELINL